MIKRNLESLPLNKLERSPAIAILGPRQVGKTTLAKRLGTNRNGLYLDMENPNDQNKLQDPFSYLSLYEDHTIIIDEIQMMPALFATLRPLIDANRKAGRFILLGSASPLLVKGVSESLAGRIAYTELTPVGITELTAATVIFPFLNNLYNSSPSFGAARKITFSEKTLTGLARRALAGAVFEENGYFPFYLNIFFSAASLTCKSPSGSGFSFLPFFCPCFGLPCF